MTSIIYKNNDFLVIFKPAGVLSQSDMSGDTDAMSECAHQLRESGESDSLYLVHRLDRVVGGVLVFARNKQSAAYLSTLVSTDGIGKEYLAVVEGVASGGAMKDIIYKDSRLNKAFITDSKRAGAKSCELEYETLDTATSEGKALSLVKIKLKTGRFHQIRAQFSSRNMPLVGDGKYGSRDSKARMPSLFAHRLAFNYKGKEFNITEKPDVTEYPWSLFGKENYD